MCTRDESLSPRALSVYSHAAFHSNEGTARASLAFACIRSRDRCPTECPVLGAEHLATRTSRVSRLSGIDWRGYLSPTAPIQAPKIELFHQRFVERANVALRLPDSTCPTIPSVPARDASRTKTWQLVLESFPSHEKHLEQVCVLWMGNRESIQKHESHVSAGARCFCCSTHLQPYCLRGQPYCTRVS